MSDLAERIRELTAMQANAGTDLHAVSGVIELAGVTLLHNAPTILAGLAAQTRPVPAIGPDDFTEDDDAINFYADGEYGVTTVERLTLRIEARPFNEEDEDAEDLYDFTLRADGELHDGHSTLAEVARSYPDVSPSIEAWKAGRTVPFAVMLTAARKLAGLAEPLPEEAA